MDPYMNSADPYINSGPSSPTGVLRILPSTLTECAKFAKAVIQSVKDGEANALEVHVMLKAFEKASEAILDCIRDNVMTQMDRYSEKSVELMGARIDKAEVGVKYKYETSGDPIWETRKSILNTAADMLKEREVFLRSLKEPLMILDEITGEIIKINPPLKTSTSGLKVTLK